MRVTLKNDFHNTEVNINVTDPNGYLSVAQTRRVKDALCGMPECCCGDVRGPQGEEGLVEVTRERNSNGKDVYRVVVHCKEEEEKIEEYRIDRAYEKIYRYDESTDAYVFHTSFFAIGAERKNRDSTILKKIQKWETER